MNIPEKKLFDVCLELNKLAFPFSHRDENSLFFVRPDMMIRRQDFEIILGDDERQYSRWFNEEQKKKTTKGNPPQRLIDEVIFKPSYEDLFKETHGIVNQLTETLTAGWFAYTGVRPVPTDQKEKDLLPDFIKGNGATPWFALADAWIQVQKWKLQK